MPRYIDSNRLLELYELTTVPEEEQEKLSVPLEVVKQNILDIPTADVEEVRHGRWIVSTKSLFGDTYTCSFCKKEYLPSMPIDGLVPGKDIWLYCPNCGAKMDLKEDADENGNV